MILSRWQGFEIDSSEGYYLFSQDLESLDRGFEFMERLLRSPLLSPWISFTIVAMPEHESPVKKQLKDMQHQGIIIEMKEQEFCRHETEMGKRDYSYYLIEKNGEFPEPRPAHRDPDYMAPVEEFLRIAGQLKEKALLISVNFEIRCFENIPPEELYALRDWFTKQYGDRERAQRKWEEFEQFEDEVPEEEPLSRGYAVIGEDSTIDGVSTHSDCYNDSDPLQGSFELYCKRPCYYRLVADPNDPTFMVYLAGRLLDEFEFKLQGMNSCDNSPPNLELSKGD